jgi:hypothetical protein
VTLGTLQACFRVEPTTVVLSSLLITHFTNLYSSFRKSPYHPTVSALNKTYRNTFDPVTSLGNAKRSNDRLGNNARLIQQVDGLGHTTLGQVSFCTARLVRAYWVDGSVPTGEHTNCTVDQKPWQPWNNTVVAKRDQADEQRDEADLLEAWKELAKNWQPRLLF